MLAETLQRRTGLSSSSDYSAYHRYTSHRLKKLRRRAGLGVRSGKSYAPKPLAPKDWPLLVLQAERCWAAAMSARAALEADATAPASVRHRLVSRLAKAVKFAELAAAQASETGAQALEFHTYVALLCGDIALEKQQWPKVSLHFSKARLGLLASGDYEDVLSSLVDPALRLALAQDSQDYAADLTQTARQIVHTQAPNFLGLVKGVDGEVLKSVDVESVEFRGHVAEVRYDELSKIIVKAREADQALESATTTGKSEESPSASSFAASFDAVLAQWDALYLATTSIANEIRQAGKPREQSLDILATYAQFHLLRRRIQRDAVVAAREAGPNAVRLYDVVLQSCDSLAELPGVNSDDALLAGIAAMRAFYAVRRLVALAALYPLGSREALALVRRASTTKLSSENLEELPLSGSDVAALEADVARLLRQTYGVATVYREMRRRSTQRGSLATDLGFVPLGEPLVADAKASYIEFVPVKPVFYDVAFNYLGLEVPELEDEPKKGLFGMFK